MLISIVLTLVSPAVKTLPGFLGRANYAATLARLSEVDPHSWRSAFMTPTARSR
ncbi:MAG: hypothetical protein NZ553_17225 [Caldilinea sp.]|nr:hypothetical protein [Caldilinea sp.]MDW8442224.1 hypothetical protein [Caldilineaceae bacterium]